MISFFKKYWFLLILLCISCILCFFSFFRNVSAAAPPILELHTVVLNRTPCIVTPFSSAGISDQIEYRKHVGDIPEPDPEDEDLDFWLKVTEPPTEKELAEEDWYGDMELLAQLIQSEAGNQDLTGMRYVADVVLNRVASPDWPNTIHDVIFQKGQFEVTWNGMFDDAAWNTSDRARRAAQLEMEQGRLDAGILYFSTYKANGHGFWKHGAHWFSY